MSLKDQIKRAGGALCAGRLFQPWVSSRLRDSVNIVYYHFVGDTAPHYEAFYAGCTMERFARDLEQLSRVFEFATTDEVVELNRRKTSPEKPVVAVTFDDGFDLRRTPVMEALARYRVRATTFVITSCIDNKNLMWRHKLSALRSLAAEETCVAGFNAIADRLRLPRIGSASQLMEAAGHWEMEAKDRLADELWGRCRLSPVGEYLSTYKPYFGWEGLRDWIKEGHSVGFHTHTHPYCSRLRREELQAEIVEPAAELKKRLGLKEVSLSYPFGDRLPEELEDELFARGHFPAFFGIRGTRKTGTSNQKLERMAVEKDGVPWAVFTRSLLNGLSPQGH